MSQCPAIPLNAYGEPRVGVPCVSSRFCFSQDLCMHTIGGLSCKAGPRYCPSLAFQIRDRWALQMWSL
eukprot:3807818-Amphidinium_carterae.3